MAHHAVPSRDDQTRTRGYRHKFRDLSETRSRPVHTVPERVAAAEAMAGAEESCLCRRLDFVHDDEEVKSGPDVGLPSRTPPPASASTLNNRPSSGRQD